MGAFFTWCKNEFFKILPVSLFFLIAFCLVDLTNKVKNEDPITEYSFFSLVIASLIMGKVVLIADYMAIIERFSHKPLIYSTLWKSLLYVLCSMLLRIIEHAIPALYDGESLMMVYQKVAEHLHNPLFWMAQTWLAYLFIIFVGYRELIFAVGTAKVKKLFFGN